MASAEHEGPEFWRVQARRYDRVVGVLNRRFDEMAHQVGGALEGSHDVLEVAAGTGLVTQHLAPRVPNLIATDTSAEMLDILRARMRSIGCPDVVVEHADLNHLRFETGSFDAVVMANVLHLLAAPRVALEEITRVLRPGGRLCAPTFCHGEHTVAHAVSRLLSLSGFQVMTRFSGPSLVSLLESAGLEVERYERYGGLLPIWLVVARRP